MQPGDVFVLNAPYNGGTHLPDVTVIAPVYISPPPRQREPSAEGHESLDPRVRGDDEGLTADQSVHRGTRPEFYVASRGHHADIGGMTPGSMPPDSAHVEEEGVLLDNVQLVAQGRLLETELRSLLASGRYPSRNIEQNLADLRAQVAACAKGIEELRKMVAQFGLPVVRAYMKHVQDNAEESVRRVLDVLAEVQPKLVEPDYPGAFRYLAARNRKRALTVLFTDVIDRFASDALVANVATLRPRHLPLAVTLRNPELDAAATQRPATARDAFRKAAAEELLHAREEALGHMRRAGVLVIDVTPERAAQAVVVKYLDLKRRGTL